MARQICLVSCRRFVNNVLARNITSSATKAFATVICQSVSQKKNQSFVPQVLQVNVTLDSSVSLQVYFICMFVFFIST